MKPNCKKTNKNYNNESFVPLESRGKHNLKSKKRHGHVKAFTIHLDNHNELQSMSSF